jgi:hypothetical protein
VELNGRQEVEVEVYGVPEVNAGQEVEVDGGQEVELEVDAGPEVNSKQRRVGDEYAMGGIRLQTSLPPPDRGRRLPELPAASRASCLLPPEPFTSSRPWAARFGKVGWLA